MSGEDAVTYGAVICVLCVSAAALALGLPLWAWAVGMGAICAAVVGTVLLP